MFLFNAAIARLDIYMPRNLHFSITDCDKDGQGFGAAAPSPLVRCESALCPVPKIVGISFQALQGNESFVRQLRTKSSSHVMPDSLKTKRDALCGRWHVVCDHSEYGFSQGQTRQVKQLELAELKFLSLSASRLLLSSPVAAIVLRMQGMAAFFIGQVYFPTM